MGQLEVACRRFAVLSGIAQDPASYITCVRPQGPEGARKGLLALVTEPAGDHPALSGGASLMARDIIVQQFYSDSSFSLTSALLKALDSANSALLHQNYSYSDEMPTPESRGTAAVAVQAGGVRTRRAQVGLTALLLKPDGAGIYIAQMSPTQAYIVHSGLVSALPEPAPWRERPGKLSVLLPRVLDLDLDDEAAEQAPVIEEEPLPEVPLPSLPLGSGLDAEVDLIYRRVEPGDFIVVVSTSLARYLDKPLAEQIFSAGDADAITHSLYMLASERGLAQCHVCVLQLGVEETSGVDAAYTEPVAAIAHEPQTNGNAHLLEESEEAAAQPTLLNVLKGPKQWFSRQRPPVDETAVADLEESDPMYGELEADNQPETEAPFEESPSRLPTQILLQHALDVPPYKTAERSEDGAEELEFDGWEDMPPALGDSSNGYVESIVQGRQSERDNSAEPADDAEATPPATATHNGLLRPRLYQVPTLFDEEWLEESDQPLSPPAPPAANRAAAVGARTLQWTGTILKNLLPDSHSREENAEGEASARRRLLVPARAAIALGIVIVLGALALSLFSVSGRANQTAINNFLAQAREENTLGNQQSLPAEERRAHLLKSLDLAKQAQQIDPLSEAPQLLIADTLSAIDALDGITRVAPKLLFDLSGGMKTAGESQAEPSTGSTSAGAVQLGAIIVQGNEAFVLDRQAGRIYRCAISTKECSTALQQGDTAGEQKVGQLSHMTLRVGTLVALDQSFVSYVFNGDTGAWEAQPLGASEAAQQPLDIASYDGNLYLLGARQGQVSKYFSGRYGDPPDDWIKEAASTEQMQNPVAMGIDGSIFVLLADGRILVMQGGKVSNVLTPKSGSATAPFTTLFTSTDTQDLYLFSPSDGSVVRVSKEGEVRATYKAQDGTLSGPVSGMTVDEGRGKLFFLEGGRVYEASLNPRKSTAPANPAQQSAPINQNNPEAKPTAAP